MSSITVDLIRVLFDAKNLGYEFVKLNNHEEIEFSADGKEPLFIDEYRYWDLLHYIGGIPTHMTYTIMDAIDSLDYDHEDLIKTDEYFWNNHNKTIRRKVVDLDAIPYPQRTSVLTLNGLVRINEDDWLVKGVNGELYPCSRKVFDKLYEVVEE